MFRVVGSDVKNTALAWGKRQFVLIGPLTKFVDKILEILIGRQIGRKNFEIIGTLPTIPFPFHPQNPRNRKIQQTEILLDHNNSTNIQKITGD